MMFQNDWSSSERPNWTMLTRLKPLCTVGRGRGRRKCIFFFSPTEPIVLFYYTYNSRELEPLAATLMAFERGQKIMSENSEMNWSVMRCQRAVDCLINQVKWMSDSGAAYLGVCHISLSLILLIPHLSSRGQRGRRGGLKDLFTLRFIFHFFKNISFIYQIFL